MKNLKVNYISEINQFNDWLETNQIPKSAIALWYALMHINNKARWERSFTVAISTIESKTGFKRSELFEARNILTQKGRINWKQRGGNLCAEYKIMFFSVHNTDASADTSTDTSTDAKANSSRTQKGTINKQDNKPDKTKPSKSHCGDKPPPQKKNEQVDENWKKWVDAWFTFYRSRHEEIDPSFGGSQAKALKEIRVHLTRVSIKKNPEEDPDTVALGSWEYILKHWARLDQWLQTQYDLTVLAKKINDIIGQIKNGNHVGKSKQPTGGQVSDYDLAAKIAEHYSQVGG